jgi:pimeloyl-ACP methyl ester carboxylesterase
MRMSGTNSYRCCIDKRIIFGDADPYLNKGVAQSFHEFFLTSDLFLLPKARHFVQMDEPEEVARLILSMQPAGNEQM